MKKLFIFFAIASFLTFLSCKESDKPDNIVNNNSYNYNMEDKDFWEQTEGGPYYTKIIDIIFIGSRTYAVTPNDGIYYSDDSCKTMNKIESSTLPSNIDTFFVADNLDMFIKSDQCTNMYKSTDKGNTWIKLPPISDYTYIAKFMSTDCQNNIYTLATKDGYNYNLIRSADNGQTWDSVQTTRYGSISGFLCRNGNLILTVPNDSMQMETRLSTDNGTTWQIVNKFPPTTSSITLISDKDYVIIATGFVSKSTDDGKTWKKVVKGLYPEVTRAIAKSPKGNLYLLTENGIRKSTDKGDSWTNLIIQKDIYNIKIDNNGYLYAIFGNSAIYRTKKVID